MLPSVVLVGCPEYVVPLIVRWGIDLPKYFFDCASLGLKFNGKSKNASHSNAVACESKPLTIFSGLPLIPSLNSILFTISVMRGTNIVKN